GPTGAGRRLEPAAQSRRRVGVGGGPRALCDPLQVASSVHVRCGAQCPRQGHAALVDRIRHRFAEPRRTRHCGGARCRVLGAEIEDMQRGQALRAAVKPVRGDPKREDLTPVEVDLHRVTVPALYAPPIDIEFTAPVRIPRERYTSSTFAAREVERLWPKVWLT